jgi:hypothetical protein
MKRLALIAVLALAAFPLGVMGSSAQSMQTAQIYKAPERNCNGAAPAGPSYGTFSEQQAHSTIYGTVELRGVQRETTFAIRVHEFGRACLYEEVATLTTDTRGNGFAHFTYTAHTGESTVWVSANHSATIVYRSTALPINQ